MKEKTPKKSKTAAVTQSLVIVESPTKAKTIRKFLPANYHVEACVGHIRDLPASAKEIPEKYKKLPWASLGIDVDNNFTPLYIIPNAKSKIIRHLKDLLESSSELILATDEDREGESISHHLVEVLKPKVPTKRMVFHEITKEAIEESLQNFREVDSKLVQAQESRRVLDRLYGYSLSPLLWKKIAYGLSAGRVQSVATRLIVEREEQRVRFKRGVYCGLLADLKSPKGNVEAKLWELKGKRVATGKDFDEQTGKISEGKDVVLLLKNEADQLHAKLLKAQWMVSEITEKPFSRKPSPPFITSTLQQEANRKLGLSARDAMRVAQGLYEKGFITYMRTDSTNLSQEALTASRKQVQALYGKDYLSDEPRQYPSKSKGAQEAHEAIRPAGQKCPVPQETGLTGSELALYELIWMRTVASQMAESKQLSVSISFKADDATFQATGTRILFPGFLRAYVEGQDDAEAALEEKEVILPDLKVGDSVKVNDLKVTEHETKPPARFTEATLVQMLEKEGIGRPSTYASIISTIIDRGYVRRVGNALVPTFTAFAVVHLLKKHFPELVDLKFTAQMEESLDEIAEGKRASVEFLREFYSDSKNGLKKRIENRESKIDPEDARKIKLETFPDVDFRIGRFGPYLAKKESKDAEEVRASIPEDVAPADLQAADIDRLIQLRRDGPPSLGLDPVTGKKVYVMSGRYGPYLQLGETLEAEAAAEKKPAKKKKAKSKAKAKVTISEETGEVIEEAEVAPAPVNKLKRVILPKTFTPDTVTLQDALGLLALPRTLGNDLEGHRIQVGLGRFGPFVVKTGPDLEKPEYRSLKKEDNLLTIELNRALEIFAEPRMRGRGRSKASALRDLGMHPIEKKPIEIFNGPYGFYAKCGKINASIPKEIKPEEVTLEKAIELIDLRRR